MMTAKEMLPVNGSETACLIVKQKENPIVTVTSFETRLQFQKTLLKEKPKKKATAKLLELTTETEMVSHLDWPFRSTIAKTWQ